MNQPPLQRVEMFSETKNKTAVQAANDFLAACRNTGRSVVDISFQVSNEYHYLDPEDSDKQHKLVTILVWYELQD